MKRVGSLDGLRGMSILLVVLFHYRYLGFGWLGVQIFFVLSGFLITEILLREKKESFAFYLKRFYWRRILRIFPLYFGYLAVLALNYMLFGQPEAFRSYWLSLITYTHNFSILSPSWKHSYFFSQFWSLGVEEQFYLVWPFLVYLLPIKMLRKIMVMFLIAVPAFRFFLGEFLKALHRTPDQIGLGVYWFTLSHFDAFAAGALIPVFELEKRVRNPQLLLACLFSLTASAGLANLMSFHLRLNRETLMTLGYGLAVIRNYQHVWSYSLINFCAAALLLVLVSKPKKNSIRNLFSQPWLTEIGKVAYGIYIYHGAIFLFYQPFYRRYDLWTWPGLFLFAVYLFGVFLIASLSFHFYEKKFLDMKENRYAFVELQNRFKLKRSA